MPHECTNCGRVFADGSKEMLSGCPNCGGNKFQFRPSSATETDEHSRTVEDRNSEAREPDAASGTTAEPSDTHPRADTPSTRNDAPDPSPSTGSDAPDPSPTDSSGGSNAWREAADRVLGNASDADTATPGRKQHAQDSTRDRPDPSRQWVNQRGDGDSSDRSGRTESSSRDRAESSSRDRPTRRDQQRSRPDPDADSTDPTSPAPDAASGEPDATRASSDSTSTDSRATISPKENTAQANARSDVVSPDEIAAAGPDDSDSGTVASAGETDDPAPDPDEPPTTSEGRVIEPSSDERPDLDELREELNQQFESIRIVAPGEYELNLMELYDRTEYIISLQEDGRYVIEVPDTWDTTPDSSENS
ncbi:hypothetical protein DVK02_10010 [Halobellus sp. Atlit-31R]|nr:hypothetical protein DVK02_10010 [Halobellus sp. Atlit-31R]